MGIIEGIKKFLKEEMEVRTIESKAYHEARLKEADRFGRLKASLETTKKIDQLKNPKKKKSDYGKRLADNWSKPIMEPIKLK